jgi:hypothetical protein
MLIAKTRCDLRRLPEAVRVSIDVHRERFVMWMPEIFEEPIEQAAAAPNERQQ